MKDFLNFCKSYFISKGICYDDEITLAENNNVLTKNSKISDAFKNNFVNITEELGIYKSGYIPPDSIDIADRIKCFNNYPSIKMSKEKYKCLFHFSFEFVSTEQSLKYINQIDRIKFPVEKYLQTSK